MTYFDGDQSGALPKPWEKQLGETDRAYGAFQVYRDLAPLERSLFMAAEKIGYRMSKAQRERRQAPGHIKLWSVRWRWVSRARAWDRELDRRNRQTQQQRYAEMAERHVHEAVFFQRKMLQRLSRLDPDELTPGQLVRWLDITTRIERQGMGLCVDLAEKKERESSPGWDTFEQLFSRALGISNTASLAPTDPHQALPAPTGSPCTCDGCAERLGPRTDRSPPPSRRYSAEQDFEEPAYSIELPTADVPVPRE